MKNIISILFLLLCVSSQAQNLKGKIVDAQGKPIAYAGVYVSETKAGCMSSETGEFLLPLKPGQYTLVVQHLSYQTVTQTVVVPQAAFLEIKMENKDIVLKGVSVSAKDEDKAYRIIRNTVAKSPYYRKQLLSYKATFYAKGTMKIKDVPKLAEKILAKDMPIRKGDVYTEESVSEVRVSPNKTEQKVISKRSSYPKELNIIGMDEFGYYNIYRNTGDFISPVTKEGLSAYRYQLEYLYHDNDLLIYHIKVIPRNKTPFAYSGYIDIIDGSWHVYSFDLKTNMDFGIAKVQITFKQNYVPIEKNVWMPGSFHVVGDAKMMGYHLEINTSYSIQYKDYTINPVLSSPNPPAEVTPEKKQPVVSKKSEKLTQQITEIMEKDNLTTRDAIKLVDLVEAKNKEDQKNNPRNDSINSLEIQKRFFLTMDSNALDYDSARWADYRAIPLSEEEANSFEQKQINDSIKEEKKKLSLKEDIEIRKKKNKKKDKTFSFGVGFMKSTLAFNAVDGFKAGLHLYANKRFKDSAATTLNNGATFGYAFAAKHFFFDASSQWNYNPKRFASVELFGGKQSYDFNKERGNGDFIIKRGTISSLFFRKNLIQYYDRTYIGVKHKMEVFHGFQTAVGFSYEQQHPLENHSDYSFFFRKTRQYKPNIPHNDYVANNPACLSAQNAFLLNISISYTPKMFFRYSENRKEKYYAGSKYPTFTLSWKKGIDNLLGSNSNFDYLELNTKQNIDLNFLKTFQYNVSAGVFPNRKNAHFSDFKHFHTNDFWVVFSPFYGAFNTMSNYNYSTNEWFITGHAKYETPYLLLKFIPGLNKTLITENLHLSFLANPLTKSYLEVGYSLSKIYFIGNIGFFVGFNEFHSPNWSLRIGIGLSEW